MTDTQGFQRLPKRWVVARRFAWLSCRRRRAKGNEATIASVEAWLFLAGIKLPIRRIARTRD